MVKRHLLGNYRLLSRLGLQGTGRIVTEVWPVWDSIFAGAVYHRGHARYSSTVLVDKLELKSRLAPLPRPKKLIAETEGLFEEDGLARRCRVGEWELVWLAEVDQPVPIIPLSDAELGVFPTKTRDLLQLGVAAGNAAFNSYTKWLAVEDDGGLIETAFEMSEMLGYPPADHSWIPMSWLTTPVEPGFHLGYETVTGADGLETTLRYISARVNGVSVYLPRLWFGERISAGPLAVELSVDSNEH